MRYVNDSLAKDEDIVQAMEMTQWQYAVVYLSIFVFVFIPLEAILLFAFILFVSIWLDRWSTEMAITNKRVIIKTGLISRSTDEIKISSIEGIDLRQGLLGRMVGYGDIEITGTGGKSVSLKSVKDVIIVRKALAGQVG